MFGWYGKERLAYIRLSRANKPLWMQEIDKKHNKIRNSIRRHIEKIKRDKRYGLSRSNR